MANNKESVLFPINEAVDKVFIYKKDNVKKRKVSQIKEFIRAYNGEGVQHIALYTNDVLATIGTSSPTYSYTLLLSFL